jgi:hypothetical protein
MFIFSGRSFWQKSNEDFRSKLHFKRKYEDALCYTHVKKSRMMLQNDKEDDDVDDDVLILDTDEDLMIEMDELLSDLKL